MEWITKKANTDESQKYHAEWKKLYKGVHCESTYMKF